MSEEATSKPRRPKLSLAFGVVLLLAAAGIAWVWFYVLAPMRRFYDQDWRERHSKWAHWEEEQSSYHRFNRSPDLLYGIDDIYRFGDAKWFKWLLDNVVNGGDSFRVCGCTIECMSVISNHYFETNAEWTNWYTANQAKSQEEWIRDGFRASGIEIQLPPSSEDTSRLLGVLGKRSVDPKRVGWDGEPRLDAPFSLRYNAYRWLRDMEFDPVAFLLASDVTSLSEDVREGVVQFRKHEKSDVPNSTLGRLSFAPHPETEWQSSRSVVLYKTWFHVAVSVVTVAAGLRGFFLTRRGIRALRLKSAPALAASHPPDTAGDR